MPFDAMVGSKTPLADFLAGEGITPVPMAVLEKHKAAQLRRYRGSLVLTPWPYVAVLCVVSGALGAHTLATVDISTAGPLLALDVVAGLFVAVMFMMTLLVVLSLLEVRVRYPAQWRESPWSPYHRRSRQIPQPIRDIATRLHNRLPFPTIIYGELFQHTTVLDPYIVVQRNDERVCLGIWDGDTIIACAQVSD